jgi:acyl carrier protein
MELSATVERVIAILHEEFPLLRRNPLRHDTALLSAGLLDSFAVITLVAALESAFGIDFDVENIPFEQFETPDSIARLCLAVREGRP